MATLVDLVLDGLVSTEDGAEVGAPPALAEALHAAVRARAPNALRVELDALQGLVDALIGRGHLDAASTIIDAVAEALDEARSTRPSASIDRVDAVAPAWVGPSGARTAPRPGAPPPPGARSMLALRAGR